MYDFKKEDLDIFENVIIDEEINSWDEDYLNEIIEELDWLYDK